MDVHREAVITKSVFISGGGGAAGVPEEPPFHARALRLRKLIELLAQAISRTGEGVIVLGGPWPIPGTAASSEGGGEDFLARMDSLLNRLDSLVQEAYDTADRLRSLTG